MRDAVGNETAASNPLAVTTSGSPDTAAPSPDPAAFATAPAAFSSSQINMSAVAGTDPYGPVEYYFAETSGNPGGSDSGWQLSTDYSDTGLDPLTEYRYTVKMRDAFGNETVASAETAETTLDIGAVDLLDGLVGYWPFNDDYLDWAGGQHDASPAGSVPFAAGILGQAVNTASAGLNTGNWNPSEGTGQVSGAAWVKWNGENGTWQAILAKRNGYNSTDDPPVEMWHVECGQTGSNFTLSSFAASPAVATLTTGQWLHYAFTFDGTTATAYLNGQPTGSGPFTMGSLTTAAMLIGIVQPTNVNPFNGLIDEAAIWNRPLTHAEVLALYNGGSGYALSDILPPPPQPNQVIMYAVLNDALADFPNNNAGNVPSYIDAGNDCLAINAAQYKDQWAAAEGSFAGESGTYVPTVVSLTETDGECTYKLYVNGVLVGSAQNPQSAQDYQEVEHVLPEVEISNGDTIRVEFNTHSNGLIPEGSGYAYARGRWRRVIFDRQITVPTGVYAETGGLIIMEMENTETANLGQWQTRTAIINEPGTVGTGGLHLEFMGNTINGGSPNSPLTYRFHITNAGTYRFYLRAHKRLEGEAPDKCNDCYVKLAPGTEFTSANPAVPQAALTSDTKCYGGVENGWGWANNLDGNGAGHTWVGYNLNAGQTYTLTISGRSLRFNIDRIILHNPAMITEATAKDPGQPESPRGE